MAASTSSAKGPTAYDLGLDWRRLSQARTQSTQSWLSLAKAIKKPTTQDITQLISDIRTNLHISITIRYDLPPISRKDTYSTLLAIAELPAQAAETHINFEDASVMRLAGMPLDIAKLAELPIIRRTLLSLFQISIFVTDAAGNPLHSATPLTLLAVIDTEAPRLEKERLSNVLDFWARECYPTMHRGAVGCFTVQAVVTEALS